MIAVGTVNLAVKIVKGFQSTPDALAPCCILLMNLLSRRSKTTMSHVSLLSESVDVESLLNATVTDGIVDSLCSALQKHMDCHLFVNVSISLLCLLTESGQ